MLIKTSRHLRTHLVAYVALFIALGGTSVAATNALVPRNSVSSAQVINRSLQKVDLSTKAVAALRGARGPRGTQGPQGLKGDPGVQGLTGGFTAANIAYSNGPIAHMCAFNGGACAGAEAVAHCPAGKVAIGGAWAGDAPDPPVAATIEASFPTFPAGSNFPNGWALKMVNNADVTASFHVSAVCAG